MKFMVSQLKHRTPLGTEGVTALEFSFAAPVIATVIIAAMEFGAIMMTSTLMESSLREAARFGITGQQPTGQTRLERITAIIDERTLGLIDVSQANVGVLVYPSFSDIGRGEDYVDGNANGSYDVGETFTDENGNGTWDSDVGVASSGDSGDIVVYRLSYAWPIMTPLASKFIGANGALPLNASIVVRNEPWDGLDGGS